MISKEYSLKHALDGNRSLVVSPYPITVIYTTGIVKFLPTNGDIHTLIISNDTFVRLELGRPDRRKTYPIRDTSKKPDPTEGDVDPREREAWRYETDKSIVYEDFTLTHLDSEEI